MVRLWSVVLVLLATIVGGCQGQVSRSRDAGSDGVQVSSEGDSAARDGLGLDGRDGLGLDGRDGLGLDGLGLDGGGGGAVGDAGLRGAAFERYVQARCDNIEGCISQNGRQVESREGCVEYYRSIFPCTSEGYATQVKSLDDCLAWMTSQGCEYDVADLGPCRAYLYDGMISNRSGSGSDPIPAGASCAGNGAVCAKGLECVASRRRAEGVCSICLPPLRVGQNCVARQDGYRFCGPDSYCDRENSELCVERGVEGDSCADRILCRSGLRCRSGICTGPLPRGASCGAQDTCRGLLTCLGGVCTDRRSAGEPCDQWQDCLADMTCQGGLCKPLHTCGDPSTGSLCQRTGQCADGDYCKDGACVPRPTFGESCVGLEFLCVPGATCHDERCVAWAQVGESCVDAPCDRKTGYCDDNGKICRSLRGAGERCEQARQCLSSYCAYPTKRCIDPTACHLPD